MKKEWIKKAIKNPGSLTKEAKSMGMTVAEHCAHGGNPMKTKKRCSLRETLLSFKK